MRLIAVGWGEGDDGAVLEVPDVMTDEEFTLALEGVEVPNGCAYDEIFHAHITMLASRLGGRVVSEEWFHMGF